jgi:hypothetical protein
MAMTFDVAPSPGKAFPGGIARLELTRLVGRNFSQGSGVLRNSRAILILLAVVAMVGCLAWTLHSRPTGAQSVAVASQVESFAQNPSPSNSVIGPAETATATLVSVGAGAPLEAEAAPLDRLRISSQSWRRGGLGSNALVTFTLRNGNDFAVKEIGISCAFTRRDGRHLTDRTRLIPDTLGMKSRKTFAHMHIGFVNVNADKAKCQLVSASRV